MTVKTQAARVLRGLARRLDQPGPPSPRAGAAQAPQRNAAGGPQKNRPQKNKPPNKQAAAADLPAAWFTQSESGTRSASMFFDKYPRFYETSQTTATRGRLNLRYEAIFAENRDILAGAKVLDIASHDGRWSLAALECGAESVIGIEARPDLVENSKQTLAEYGWGPDRCSFVAADVFEALGSQAFDVDVVLCLGFLYHTLRYNELMHGIRAANPRHVIIDTVSPMMMQPNPVVRIKSEPAARESNAVSDQYSQGDAVLIGQPNLKAISIMANAYDYEVERVSDWDGLIRDNPDLVALGDVKDYVRHIRTTIRCADRRPRDT